MSDINTQNNTQQNFLSKKQINPNIFNKSLSDILKEINQHKTDNSIIIPQKTQNAIVEIALFFIIQITELVIEFIIKSLDEYIFNNLFTKIEVENIEKGTLISIRNELIVKIKLLVIVLALSLDRLSNDKEFNESLSILKQEINELIDKFGDKEILLKINKIINDFFNELSYTTKSGTTKIIKGISSGIVTGVSDIPPVGAIMSAISALSTFISMGEVSFQTFNNLNEFLSNITDILNDTLDYKTKGQIIGARKQINSISNGIVKTQNLVNQITNLISNATNVADLNNVQENLNKKLQEQIVGKSPLKGGKNNKKIMKNRSMKKHRKIMKNRSMKNVKNVKNKNL